MNGLKERRQRRAISRWDHRRTLVFDERTPTTHRLTCLAHDMTDQRALADFASIAADVIARGVPTLVLDLSRVNAADSKLVGLLLQLLRDARRRAVRLRVFPSQTVHLWLSVCRVDTVFRNPGTRLIAHSDSPDRRPNDAA